MEYQQIHANHPQLHRISSILGGKESLEITTDHYKQIDLQTMTLSEVSLESILSAAQISHDYYSKLKQVSSYITKCRCGYLVFVPGMRMIVSNGYVYTLVDAKELLSSEKHDNWERVLHTALKDAFKSQTAQNDQLHIMLDRAFDKLVNMSFTSSARTPEAIVIGAVVELLCKRNAEEFASTKNRFESARKAKNLISMQLALQEHGKHVSNLDSILYSIDYFVNQKVFSQKETNSEDLLIFEEIVGLFKLLGRSLYTLKYHITEYVEYSSLYLSNYRESLDRKRNKLITIQLHITYIALGVGFISLISGILGTNLMNFANYPEEPPPPYLRWSTMGSLKPAVFYGTCFIAFGIFNVVVGMLVWYTRTRLDY